MGAGIHHLPFQLCLSFLDSVNSIIQLQNVCFVSFLGSAVVSDGNFICGRNAFPQQLAKFVKVIPLDSAGSVLRVFLILSQVAESNRSLVQWFSSIGLPQRHSQLLQESVTPEFALICSISPSFVLNYSLNTAGLPNMQLAVAFSHILHSPKESFPAHSSQTGAQVPEIEASLLHRVSGVFSNQERQYRANVECCQNMCIFMDLLVNLQCSHYIHYITVHDIALLPLH